jgi:photosystem II stability/assembly factor-like uncharacterized protein
VQNSVPRIVLAAALAAAIGGSNSQAATPRRPDQASSKPNNVASFTDPLLLRGLQWRCIGPYIGGRVTAVTGVPGQRNVYYFGGTGSGIWKSIDNGVSWQPVSDGQLGTGSVGAIEVAPSDPNVLYVGMGEACVRGNVSHGDGVYKSTDAGKTWMHLGLADTRQIGQIRIDPRDPNRVYVAALGHTFGPSRERGVYRSMDGGTTWKNVLAVNDSTGAVDLALDPNNPRLLYAGFWQVMRTPWSLESGGAGSALYKSTDGGDSWKRLTGGGLPKGPWGRTGITVSGAQHDRVYAIIEAEDGGVYRSDDGGKSWKHVNQERNLRQRAWYYTHIYADPSNADVVYVLNVQLLRSKDGGRTFAPISVPHGDNHDLWIDPQDSERLFEGNDGGVIVSLDGGASWSREDNQPTAQFYHAVTDDQFPYRVYGAQQDRSTVSIASRTNSNGIRANDWYNVGGCESGYIAPSPDGKIVYSGCYDGYIGRYNHETDEERDVTVYPENPMGSGAEGMKYRFQWTFPIVLSPHDPRVVYTGGNMLFRSDDGGTHWTAISGDLTRNDKKKLGPSGGPITKDNTSIEYYCTLFAVAESKLARGLIWAGSDDGLVHMTRDGGAHWSNVTPAGLPDWSMISQIDPSPHDPGTAFVAANHYKQDDYRPYAFVTTDYGKSWRKIVNGLPADSFVRVVRQDPVRENLLYCGTEGGVYFSPDFGANWWPLRMNTPGASDAETAALAAAHAAAVPADAGKPAGEDATGLLPVVPVTDLVVKNNDLVISTQGRSFWILDDVSALRQMNPSTLRKAHLFDPSPAPLFGGPVGGGSTSGQNPARGVVFYYWLQDEPKEKTEITLEITDGQGKLVRKVSSKEAEGVSDDDKPPKLPARAGLNRFAWDFRYPDTSKLPGMILWSGSTAGPEVVPGTYRATFKALGDSETVAFEVRPDPRLGVSAADYQARFDLLQGIYKKVTETHDAVARIRDLRDQIKETAERTKSATKDTTIAAAAKTLDKNLTTIEEALYQTKNKSSQDPLNFPIRLNDKLASLTGVVESAVAPPTSQTLDVYRDLTGKVDAELGRLHDLIAVDLTKFNQLVRDQNVPAVVVREKKLTASAEKASKGDDDDDRGDEDRDGFERRRR